jgi:hypothetical protein
MVQNAASRSGQSGPLTTRAKRASITPGAIANATAVDVDFAFAEAAVGDVVSVSFNSALVAGILFAGASIATAGHVTLRFSNITGAPVTQTAIVANVSIEKKL